MTQDPKAAADMLFSIAGSFGINVNQMIDDVIAGKSDDEIHDQQIKNMCGHYKAQEVVSAAETIMDTPFPYKDKPVGD